MTGGVSVHPRYHRWLCQADETQASWQDVVSHVVFSPFVLGAVTPKLIKVSEMGASWQQQRHLLAQILAACSEREECRCWMVVLRLPFLGGPRQQPRATGVVVALFIRYSENNDRYVWSISLVDYITYISSPPEHLALLFILT